MRTKNRNSKKRDKSKTKAGKMKDKLAKLKKKKLKKGQHSSKEIDKNDRNVKKSNYSYSFKKYQNLPLRDKMLEKLKSSRFRKRQTAVYNVLGVVTCDTHLDALKLGVSLFNILVRRYMNEQLYNMRGKDALKYFQSDKDAFLAYHEGYKQQVQSWPKNPVDVVIKSLEGLCRKNKNIVIGDFGCGDAKLAKSLPDVKIHSFDLVSLDPCVTVCDMASTPLEDGSLDVAVFCLSLMGTNFSEYVMEANRVLKIGGVLKIAEVESRFENVEKFIHLMSRYGFSSISKNFSFRLFYFMDFKKERDLGKNFKKKAPPLQLKPCLYKKR